jgi:hypothetical protein
MEVWEAQLNQVTGRGTMVLKDINREPLGQSNPPENRHRERGPIPIFKIAIVLIGVTFLIMYYYKNQNGRYKMHLGDGYMITEDTQTGKLYVSLPKDNHTIWKIIDPIKECDKFHPVFTDLTPMNKPNSTGQDNSLYKQYSLFPPYSGKKSHKWGDLSNFPTGLSGR